MIMCIKLWMYITSRRLILLVMFTSQYAQLDFYNGLIDSPAVINQLYELAVVNEPIKKTVRLVSNRMLKRDISHGI